MTAMVMFQETRRAILLLSSKGIGTGRAPLQSACKQRLMEMRVTERLAHRRAPALRLPFRAAGATRRAWRAVRAPLSALSSVNHGFLNEPSLVPNPVGVLALAQE